MRRLYLVAVLPLLLGAAVKTGGPSPTSNVSQNRVTATGSTTARTLAEHFATVIWASNYAATGAGLAEAAGDAAAGGKTLVITAPITITTAVGTISAPVRFEGGGKLILNTGGSVTLSGALSAPLTHIFDTTGVGTLTFSAKVDHVVPQWWGAVGDGVTDDTAAIQAAIDAAAPQRGSVEVSTGTYRVANLMLKPGVTLRSRSGQFPDSTTSVVLKNDTMAGWVIDTPVGGATQAAIEGIAIRGGGAGVATGGVRIRGVTYWAAIRRCTFDNIADHAILTTADTVAVTIEDVLVINSLLNTVRAAPTGVVDIDGSDHFLSRIEASGSASGASAGGFINGLAIRGNMHTIIGCIGEVADNGWYISSTKAKFAGCRADANWGHGFVIAGGHNTFTSTIAFRNGRTTANTYDGWKLTGGGNLLASVSSINETGSVKYGFEDTLEAGYLAGQNSYVNAFSLGHATAPFFTSAYWGSGVLFPPTIVIPAASAAVDVGQTSFVGLQGFASPTTITSFANGVTGQTVRFLGSPNATIQNNAAIQTSTNTDKRLRAGRVYEFTLWNGKWYERDEENQQPVSADRGDTSQTLIAGTDAPVQTWATTLTANRTVTLSTTGAANGDTFRIVRTGLGAFTLTVQDPTPTTIYTLPGGTKSWADFAYTGSVWVITAYGTIP